MQGTLVSAFALAVTAAAAAQEVEEVDARPRPLVEASNAFSAQARFDRPLLVAFAPTDPGGAYVVTQPGQVFRVPRTADGAERTAFLDLGGRVYVNDNWEEGLLGFAFDPDYAQNGQVYVYYSEKTPLQQGEMGPGKKAKSTRQSIVARYATRADAHGVRVADPASELRLMTIFQPFGNHNGGTLVFGPDRMLYIALGDGGAANDPFGNGQDKSVLLGKVLRIDVAGATAAQPYKVPPDNPFVGEAGARGEIWCYGLRNPWRIAFDRRTGDLWCGDVGQNRVEEVDRLVKGGNYGWNLMEGSEVFKGRRPAPLPGDLIAPVAEYPHSDGLSVTGGCVYRGAAIPALAGCYVFGDFSTMRLWAVQADPQAAHDLREIGRAPGQLSSFAEEPDGELLMTCFDGKVYRLVPCPRAGG